MNFSGKFGSDQTIWYPASGYRLDYVGSLNYVGYYGLYWSASPNYYDAYYLYFNYDGYVDPSDYNGRAFGYSVRCAKEVMTPSTPSEPEGVNLSGAGTANSYIVSSAGSYKFSTVKGNSSESVGAVASAEVLWESFGTDVDPNVGDLVKNAVYSDGYITFQTADAFKEGNAVIAAKDADGNILWSWHIWLTDEPQGQEYYNNAGTMMDRNLGATSATPGDVGALGLLYQWGRKDPFLGSSSIHYSSMTEAKSTITWPSAVESDSSNGTIEYATANPTTFITYNSNNNYDWYYTGDSSTDDTRWTTSETMKSIYDPCPQGWRVPDGGGDRLSDGEDNGVWSKALGSTSFITNSSLYSITSEGMNFSGKFGSASTIWYPASGSREGLNGSLNYVGYYSRCWSASPYNTNNKGAYCLYFYYYGDIDPSNSGSRVAGFSVRCIRDNSSSDLPTEPDIPDSHLTDYVDEYGINHGRGVDIDGVVWAPVNCGYHETDYQYGKLYQWGRKYGQGYDPSVASVSSIVSGPVSLSVGQSSSNSNNFYTYSSDYDWIYPQDDLLWYTGGGIIHRKTDYDPCPNGWRIPTYKELDNLSSNYSSWTTNGGQSGYWFSGSNVYSESGARVFFPAAGFRWGLDGYDYSQGEYGYYWSDRTRDGAYSLSFSSSYTNMNENNRANGYSVRCVQE
jgi:uncharacterized protein (TIGR02145 family)